MPALQLLGTIIRTLTASGYSIRDSTRQPSHIEVSASSHNEFGSAVPYLFGITDLDSFSNSQVLELQSVAESSGATLILVANNGGPGTLSVDELLRRLGGPIPSWRALSDDYSQRLEVLGTNSLPPGETGTAWKLYEEAVSDGLEFLFGRRVKRLGAAHSGSKFPDAIASTPDEAIIVVDAKSAASGFEATSENLRALREYAVQQHSAQKGHNPVTACLIASSAFVQSEDRLRATAAEFLSDVGVPLAFISSATLGQMVDLMRPTVRLRNAIRWRRVFCVSGALNVSILQSEMKAMGTLKAEIH